jgi:hypothetical protein
LLSSLHFIILVNVTVYILPKLLTQRTMYLLMRVLTRFIFRVQFVGNLERNVTS